MKILSSFFVVIQLVFLYNTANILPAVALPPSGAFPDLPSVVPSDLPPEVVKGYYNYLTGCFDVGGHGCWKNYYYYITADAEFDKECCSSFMAAGGSCYNELVKLTYLITEFKVDATLSIPKSRALWKTCINVTGVIPPPSVI